MKISVIIENTSAAGMPTEHGLSLWIEACDQQFFFDLGQSSLFAENAKAMNVDISEAEFAIISHGHYDHGGGMPTFLSLNSHAPVIINRHAFTDCYSLKDGRARYIGLPKSMQGSDRLIVNDDIMRISDGLTLFSGSTGHDYFSPANSRILKKIDGELMCDDFRHEQSLIITEQDRRVLIAGCAHSGIHNIMAKAERIAGAPMTDVITGMHLVGVEDARFIDGLAQELMKHNCHYYTCHCTGEAAYQQLKSAMGKQIDYISCGDVVTIPGS